MPRRRQLGSLVFLVVVFLCTDCLAQSIEFALAPLENKAEISDDELALLTDAVHAAFLDGTTTAQVMPNPGVCDSDVPCLTAMAKNLGTKRVVVGSVILFSGEYVAKLEVYDAQSGAVTAKATTESFADLKGLLTAIKIAAVKIKQSAAGSTAASPAPVPQPTPAPQPAPAWNQSPPAPRPTPAPQPAQPAGEEFHASGGLKVTSDPSGAKVYARGSLYLGTTPLTKNLEQGVYSLSARLDGYNHETKGSVTVFPGEYTRVHFKLKKTNVPVVLGISATIPGAAFLVTGLALFASESNQEGSKTMGAWFTVSGGILAAGGTALIIWGAVRNKEKKKERRKGVTMAPTNDGFVAGYTHTF